MVIPQTLLICLTDGQVQEMPLDEYLKGVVPAEIGLAKPLEALKAQAIAARSYAVTTRRHAADGFDLCTTAHCQVWKPQNRYPDSDRAVDETSGLVVTYNGQIVSAPFFGHCDGRTRNSEEVWSGKIAYCRSVPCICGHTSLYGHGVGMCQRGAVAMAHQGATAEEILKHYYTGIEISHALIVVPGTAQVHDFCHVGKGQGTAGRATRARGWPPAPASRVLNRPNPSPIFSALPRLHEIEKAWYNRKCKSHAGGGGYRR